MTTMQKSRVLIVDDEYYFRKLLINLIDWSAIGFEVVAEAENGSEAFQIMNEQSIDLVISDIEMPQMSGLDFGKKIRDINSSVKLIYITGYDLFAYAQKAITFGANYYLLKPIDEEELEKALVNTRVRLTKEWEEQRYINLLKKEAGYTSELNLQQQSAARNQLIRKVISFVHERYADENLSLQQTASVLYVNPSYLSHIFKKDTGESFVEYVTNVRLNKAMELLRMGFLDENITFNVTTVARQVGYSDPFYFSKCFKKKFGITPNKVSRQHYS